MYLDEIEIGTRYELDPVVMEKAEMFAFAKRYDPIPLHLDEAYARNTRFGGLIAPGLMTFALLWGQFEKLDIFGEALVAGKTTQVEWFRPVYMEDVLHGVAVITEVRRRNAHNGIARITLDACNQHGERLLTSTTEAVVRYRP